MPFIITSDFLFFKKLLTPYMTPLYNNDEVIRLSTWDKLIARIMALDKNMRFEELRKILESYGYEMRRPSGGSSHCTFRKPGCAPITIPVHEPRSK